MICNISAYEKTENVRYTYHVLQTPYKNIYLVLGNYTDEEKAALLFISVNTRKIQNKSAQAFPMIAVSVLNK